MTDDNKLLMQKVKLKWCKNIVWPIMLLNVFRVVATYFVLIIMPKIRDIRL